MNTTLYGVLLARLVFVPAANKLQQRQEILRFRHDLVVEGFALKIVSGDVPESLLNVSLRSLDMGLLQAGAGVKGEFENRLKQVIEEVQTSVTPIILFIDEAHTLIGAGNSGEGAQDATKSSGAHTTRIVLPHRLRS